MFTIAVGKPIYLRMACALARSFKLWHKKSDIPFYLVTDAELTTIPHDLSDIRITSVKPNQYGKGFTPKLHLDQIAPAQQSLFIDADCLCVGSLMHVFEAFEGHSVSVIGREICDGEWFGDVSLICKNFNVKAIPRFNGGVYYLERGGICNQVFETARRLEHFYDEIGFVRLRGCANDEVLISLAMALHHQKPIPEHGDIMNSLLAGPGGIELDVFRGYSLLKNPKRHPNHNPWYELEEMHPQIVHFLGSNIAEYPYHQEELRLKLVCGLGWHPWLATMFAKLFFSWPWQASRGCKNALRPFYHVLFKPRKLKPSREF